MNRWRTLRVFAGLVCAVRVLPAQDGGAVEGRAVNSVTHAAVEGVEVRLWTKEATNYVTATDAAGAFRIDGVKTGQYNYRLEKSGYVSTEVADPRKTLRVGLAKDAIRLEVELTPFATLAGRVLESDGKPAAKVEVFAGDFKSATTDEEGRFAFDKLEPGSFELLATPTSRVAATPSPQGERVAVLPTYFPSALDRSLAERINVQAGADLSGYDIRLRSSPVYRVRGVVLDETGKLAEKARVTLTRREAQAGTLAKLMFGSVTEYIVGAIPGSPEAQVSTAKDGTFEFPAVRAGDWLLAAELEGEWDPVRRIPSERRVEEAVLVERQDIDHVEMRLAAPFDLAVEVDWGDAPLGAHPRFAALELFGMDGQQPVMFLGGANIQIVPGRYRVAGGIPMNGYSPQSVQFAGHDVMGQVVDLRPGSGPLRVVYKRSTTSLRGSVEKGPGATVLVWSQMAEGPVVMNAITCGSNGNFEGFVQPGDYYALAVDRVDTRTVADSAFLKKMIMGAASVSVAEGATASLQLPLTPWPE
jgi:hypothetical protein